MFDIDAIALLQEKENELRKLLSFRDRIGLLYARTVQNMWNDKLYRSAIDLEGQWHNSPLHREVKDLTKYVYEIQSHLGKTNSLSEREIDTARSVPMSALLPGKGPHLCPFHKERTPSFHTKGRYYKCFGCQEGGDTIRYLMKVNKMDFRTAIQYLLRM
jgi:hypothetical protein